MYGLDKDQKLTTEINTRLSDKIKEVLNHWSSGERRIGIGSYSEGSFNTTRTYTNKLLYVLRVLNEENMS